MSLAKSSATVAFYTLISRITGFARDAIMANLIGASYLSDAFFVAFKLPNFFRRLFAEGAFNAAFVPSFASMLTTDGREAAIRFASEVLSVLIIALLILNALFLIFMPWIMPLFAPGFADSPAKFSLTVELSRLCFPYILFISLVSLLGGILNSLNTFAAPAAAPIMLNLCMIAGMIFLSTYTATPAHALAISVFVAGIVQCIWLVLACMRADCLPSLLLPKLTPKVKTMLLLMAPAALGSGVQQVNLLVDVIIASHIPGAVSFLYYADRITELPIGMIGVAVGTALLPMLSKILREGKREQAIHSMNRGLEIVLLFGIPATTALAVIAELVIRVIYEHGAFSTSDRIATTNALLAFTAGLPAFLAVKVFAPAFYADHDTKTPLKIALTCVLVNLVLNLILIHPFAHVGMAMATSIASWVNLALMIYILHKRGLYRPDGLLKERLAKMLLSAAIMSLVIAVMQRACFEYFPEQHSAMLALLLCVFTGAGMAIYGVMLLALKTTSVAEVKAQLMRKKNSPPPEGETVD